MLCLYNLISNSVSSSMYQDPVSSNPPIHHLPIHPSIHPSVHSSIHPSPPSYIERLTHVYVHYLIQYLMHKTLWRCTYDKSWCIYMYMCNCVVGVCSECGFGFTSGCVHGSWFEAAHVVCVDVSVFVDHSCSNGLPVRLRE